MRHRSLALSATLVVTLAACGNGTASPSPSSSSGAPSVAPSVGPATPAPSVPTPSSSSALASPSVSSAVPHGAPTLEVNLPRAFHGKPLFMLSFGPAELAASPAGDSFNAIITAAGGDVTKAGFAVANDSAVTQDATFNAFAVSGAGGDGTKLVNAYVASAIAGGSSLSSTTSTLGGKAVTRIKSSDSNALGDSWVYAIDDVMYGVQSKDEALATEVIGLLP